MELITLANIRDQVAHSNPQDLMKVAATVANTLTVISAVIAAGVIVYGGVLILTAMGDPGKVSRGKSCIMGGVIGLIIVFVAFAVVRFVLSAL